MSLHRTGAGGDGADPVTLAQTGVRFVQGEFTERRRSGATEGAGGSGPPPEHLRPFTIAQKSRLQRPGPFENGTPEQSVHAIRGQVEEPARRSAGTWQLST